MVEINNIFKERLTDKLSFKSRYFISFHNLDTNKIIYCLDNINYCLYCEYEFIWFKNGIDNR